MTVGSTKFDKLIETIEIQSSQFEDLLKRFKITKISIQHGQSKPPKLQMTSDFEIHLNDYLNPEEISKELSSSNVIITHGGAGTIFEILRGNLSNLEALLVVENDNLMDSHQSELIEALIDLKCPIQLGKIDNLFDEIEDKKENLVKFKLPKANCKVLASLINNYLRS